MIFHKVRRKLQKVAGSESLASLAHSSSRAEGAEGYTASEVWKADEPALRKLADGDFDALTEVETLALEAIVEREARPVSLIRGGAYDDLPPPWSHFNHEPIRSTLTRVFPAIGRVEVTSSQGGLLLPIGTGFIVGERLMMTNRHVAEVFVKGMGERSDGLTFWPGRVAYFHPAREVGFSLDWMAEALRIVGVVMMHPYWDMALLQLEGMPPGVAPLRLSVEPPEALIGQQIAAISHPGKGGDSRRKEVVELEAAIYGNVFEVKRLAPGEIDGTEACECYAHVVKAMTHDCSTLGSQSGAVLVQAHTGEVVGLHFHKVPLVANYAVPMYELARDARVVDAGVNFAGSVPLTREWESYWTAAASAQPSTGAEVPDVPRETCGDVEKIAPTALAIPDSASAPQPYDEGEILAKLAQLRARSEDAVVDQARPYRLAAALLAAFDPATLVPVGAGSLSNADEVTAALRTDLVPNPYRGDDDAAPPWSLTSDARKKSLRELQSARALQEALAVNLSRAPDVPVQRLLTRAIQMTLPLEPEKMEAEDLRILATVSDWLEGTEPREKIPRPQKVLKIMDGLRDRALLGSLVTKTFTGRGAELKLLQEHITGKRQELFFVAGYGGMGKSALISRALLDWMGPPPSGPSESGARQAADRIWVRVDMDHSLVNPGSALSMLRHAAQQIGRANPELASQMDTFANSVQSQATRQDETAVESNTEDDLMAMKTFIKIIRPVLKPSGRRMVFWLDTFEEAQFLGRGVETHLVEMVFRLASSLPRVRVLVSGRALPPEAEKRRAASEKKRKGAPAPAPNLARPKVFSVKNPPMKALMLQELPELQAADLLSQLVDQAKKPDTVFSPTPKMVGEAAAALGGHPLTLRLGAQELLHAKSAKSLRGMAALKKDVRQKLLVSRIVAHLHDDELEVLVLPGLEVRAITPAVIQHVLAGPCGLGPITASRSATLFDRMREEITLVEPQTGNARMLRYRQDIRMIMLRGQDGKLTPKARSIHQNAVRLWEKSSDAQARAEEIYHRLRLQQPTKVLDQRWDAAAAPLMRSTLEELPAGPHQEWLAQKLDVVLRQNGSAPVSEGTWEQQAALEAQRYLQERKPKRALEVLAQRNTRMPGSKLYALECRAHLIAGHDDRALEVAWRGFEASEAVHKAVAVELALLAGLIDERRNNLLQARNAVARGVMLARKTSDTLLQLSALLRAQRLQRLSESQGRKRAKSAEDPKPSTLLIKAARATAESMLAARPAVLRELAAEIGAAHPGYLAMAAEHLLEGLLQAMSSKVLVETMERLDVLQASEKALFLAAGRKPEMVKTARSRIMERLHLKPQPFLFPFYKEVQQLFRSAVDSSLHMEYHPAPSRKRAATRTSRRKTAKLTPTASIKKKSQSTKHVKGGKPGKVAPKAAQVVSIKRKSPSTTRSSPASVSFTAAAMSTGGPLGRLLKLIAEADAGKLQRISRYVLEEDYSKLIHGRSLKERPQALLQRALFLNRVPDLIKALETA